MIRGYKSLAFVAVSLFPWLYIYMFMFVLVFFGFFLRILFVMVGHFGAGFMI